jgi:hypothetical protein
MPLHPEINLIIKLDNITDNHEEDRNYLRILLLDNLVKEKAGTGNKEKTSKYHYNVETLSALKNSSTVFDSITCLINNVVYAERP